MTVVDASIVVRLLQARAADQGLRARFARERRLHAPALVDAEVTSAFRGLLLSSRSYAITSSRAADILEDYADLPLVRHPMLPLQARVLKLRDHFTAHDAFYVALAEALDLPLLTDDRKFAGAPGHHATIETWQR
ncbi:type II toxin-antitoxin system VapC family toxin [Flexivirga caeni]|uniref:Ribonuclease VapC n=1 Tax=Flexivirga caeni TaxID=2294115 RepID=A0A3M9MC65_9MICO|nr:type II toxin-antitoxin system VapC family toxin [Flexivirga caeni]RNI23162.1 PIN domain-containing protein [Flexivirga caeni]